MKIALLLFLLISIVGVGCKKKEEATSEGAGVGQVQTIQDVSQLESQYKEVIAKDPKNYDAVVGLGNLYYDAGQAEKAIEIYKKALEINPNDVNVRTDMGTMYRKIGKFDEAIGEFKKAASIDPKHEQSRYNLGVILYSDKKDSKAAAEAWEDLLKVNPNHPNALELKQVIGRIRNPQEPEAKSPSSGWVK